MIFFNLSPGILSDDKSISGSILLNARIAASFDKACKSAPTKPCEISANFSKLTSLARGNSTGISDSYYRATEQQLLEDYLKAVDMLNINDDKLTLQKQVAVLNEKKLEV